jgi:hypothetical protein
MNDAHPTEFPTIDYLQRIKELVRTGQTAHLDHWGDGKFIVGENGRWHYEGFVNVLQAFHEAMRAVDPSIPAGLQTLALDPVVIAAFFGIPLQDMNWQGDAAQTCGSNLAPQVGKAGSCIQSKW